MGLIGGGGPRKITGNFAKSGALARRRARATRAQARTRETACRGAWHTANRCAHRVEPRLGLMPPRDSYRLSSASRPRLVSVHKRKLLKSLKESDPWREGP